MHLVVSNATKSSEIYSSIRKARSLTNTYSRNGSFRNELGALTDKSLICAPDNRWFYQCFGLGRIIELKDAIQIAGARYEDLSDQDFTNLKNFLDIVSKFKSMTEKFSSNQSLISEIIPELDEFDKTLAPKFINMSN